MEFFEGIVNDKKFWTIFAKKVNHRCFTDSEILFWNEGFSQNFRKSQVNIFVGVLLSPYNWIMPPILSWKCSSKIYEMLCAIWYHLRNLKNVKNTHGGVLFLVKLTLFHGCLHVFQSNCTNGTKSRNALQNTPGVTNLKETHHKLGLTWRWWKSTQVATSKTNLVLL